VLGARTIAAAKYVALHAVTPNAQQLYPDDLFVVILDQGNINVTGVVGDAIVYGHRICTYLQTHTYAETLAVVTEIAASTPAFADDAAAAARTYVRAATTAYCPQ
jgi:uncharacterized protein DUF732